MSTQEKAPEVHDKKVEDDSSSDEEHDHHDHDHHGHDHDHDHDHAHGKKANKGEKKFKKAMTKFGMKPVAGINRVTIKKSKAFFLYIDDPEVLKGADNTYVVFGEAKIQDFSSLGAEQEAKRFASEQPVATEKAAETKPAEEVKGADEGEELSEEGLKAEDIETLISHTSCTRREAVKALRETNGDSVAAIIALTK
jgi:nascent polypeptide-associated complex subunit alpha